eukprot:scaffold4036_cov248-Ochromonas_danica.AAC.6
MLKQKGGKKMTTLFYIYALGFGMFGLYMYGLVVLIYVLTIAILTYSFAELVSIVPFSGGCYGYSRCTMGPMLGYVAGMFEAAKYMLYATFSVHRLGDIFLGVYNFDEKYQIVVWLAFLVLFNLVHYFQTKMLWWTIALVGIAIFVIQVIFIFGATSEGSVANLSSSKWDNEPIDFLQTLPYSAFILSPLDAVRTCVDDQGSDIVPTAMLHILAWSTFAGLASIVAQAAYSYENSLLLKEQYAYNIGMRMTFHLSDNDKFVTLFALPGSLGCCLGFLYCAARQVRSMASSGLLPPFLAMGQGERVKDISQPVAQATSVVPLGVDGGGNKVNNIENVNDLVHGHKPTMAVFACSVLCFSLLLAGYYLIVDYGTIYTQMAQLLNYPTYQFLMMSYMIFATRFSNMDRGLWSPFGIPGALFVIAFFLWLFTTRLYYSPETNTGYGVTLVVFTVAILVYYFMVVQNRQFFSKEEQEKFMKAYVVNANKTRKRAKGASNSRQRTKGSTMMGMLAGAVGFIQKTATRGPSSRSGASSMSGQHKSGASGSVAEI